MNYCKKSAIRYNIEMLPYHMEFSYKPYGQIFGKEINKYSTFYFFTLGNNTTENYTQNINVRINIRIQHQFKHF